LTRRAAYDRGVDAAHARYEQPGVAPEYRARFSKSLWRRLANRLELVMLGRALRDAGPCERMLDVPCGAGRLAPALLVRTRTLVCADAAAAMLAEARAALGDRARLARARVEALPFPDRAFDVTVCWRLLHHFREGSTRLRILGELARVTRGAVVLSFWDAGTARARRIGRRPRGSGRVAITRERLAEEAEAAGLAAGRFFRLSGAFSALGAAVLRPR
jgi:SAM-dependent methyltransferase